MIQRGKNLQFTKIESALDFLFASYPVMGVNQGYVDWVKDVTILAKY